MSLSRDSHDREWRRARSSRATHEASARRAARRPASDRDQGRLRRRRMRIVFRAHERRTRKQLPRTCVAGGRRMRANRGRSRSGRQNASVAAGVPRLWRRAMRHLHAGHADGRYASARAQSASDHGGNSRRPCRESLPMHRLHPDLRVGDFRRIANRSNPPMRGNAEAHTRWSRPAAWPGCWN